MSPESVTRREMFLRGGTVAAGLSLGVPALAQAAVPGEEPEQTEGRGGVVLREGTNMSAALSPDGGSLAVDLVTGIWVLPAAGGRARRLTDDLQDATVPAWSPDGRSLVFQSYRDGNYHLYLIDAAGGRPRQLTDGEFDHREPAFAPDGKRVAFSSDRDGSYSIWLLELATGAVTPLTATPEEESAPRWSRDGQRVLFTVDETAIDVVTVATGERSRALTAPAGGKVYGPAFGPDDRTPSYTLVRGAAADLMLGDRQLTKDEDVFGFAANWIGEDVVYTANGRLRRRTATGSTVDIPLTATVNIARRDYRHRVRDIDSRAPQAVRGIAGPVVSPDGKQIAFRALNALYLVSADGGKPEKLTGDQYFSSDPDFSPDGRTLAYASDRLGTADLWLRDLATGKDTVVSALPGAQVAPRWSPDGKQLAFTNQDGIVSTLDIASKAVRQLTPTLFMPGRPSWSADGSTIAVAAVKPFSKRFREGTSQILTIDVAGGELRYTEPMPFRSLATRGDDGPLWSPDGKLLAFVVESTAWVVSVDNKGVFRGEPRQVTREVTDSLAWRGNNTLVYLCKGELRQIGVDGGRARTIRLDFSWSRPKAADRTVIHAGGLWDGQSRDLRRDVDIVVENGRIAAIRPHRDGEPGTVDARELVAMPGLIDAHNHWHLRGRHWGDRQGRLWLSYGITTTRSPGDPVYQMLETREALEAGTRIGPRFFATGEAIDGSRVYYNFMRPTLSRDQLALEMDRAVALGYDLIKTYVRLPVEYQRAAIEAAHRAGIPLSSHYLYPASNIGMDGMEHTGATNRLGYSHTVSRTGRAYQDAVELFVRSGMSLTPTLFNSKALYADDRSLVDDERTKVLFPDWEYSRLVADADNAGKPENAYVRQVLAANVDMVLRVHREGGFVISGTDAPLDHIAVSLHQNLRAMVEFGFSPYEALVTATRNPARRLGLAGKLGELRPGAHADITLVAGNPLADIRAAAAVRQVMTGGTLHQVDDLLTPFRAPGSAPIRHQVTPASTGSPSWWHRPEWSEHVCCGL